MTARERPCCYQSQGLLHGSAHHLNCLFHWPISFLSFCTKCQQLPFLVIEQLLLLFITFLSNTCYFMWQTLYNYLYSVHACHIESGYLDPFCKATQLHKLMHNTHLPRVGLGKICWSLPTNISSKHTTSTSTASYPISMQLYGEPSWWPFQATLLQQVYHL